jgi:hypothetical protein
VTNDKQVTNDKNRPDEPDKKHRGVEQHEAEFARFYAPFRNAEITLIDRPSDDVHLFQLRIREGRRITVVELNKAIAVDLAKALQNWADTVTDTD